MSKDHICPSCRQKEKLRKITAGNETQKKADIDEVMSQINTDLLTRLEKQVIELRKTYLTYEEIGEVMGCSRQRVEQRIRKAIEKSVLGPEFRKKVLKSVESAENRLARLRCKKSSLENQLAILAANIEFMEKKLSLLDVEQSWKNETPAAGTVEESGN